MRCSDFIDQVQILMHTQQIKYYETMFEKTNYYWLTKRKCVLTYLSTKEEFLIRQAVQNDCLECCHQLSKLEVNKYITTKKCSILEEKSYLHIQMPPKKLGIVLVVVSQEQKLKIMRQLLSWLEEHSQAQANKIPEMCIIFLNRLHTANVINDVTFSRKNSFRNSLKRLSIISNRIAPAPILLPSLQESKRCVKFNDKPTVYCISN